MKRFGYLVLCILASACRRDSNEAPTREFAPPTPINTIGQVPDPVACTNEANPATPASDDDGGPDVGIAEFNIAAEPTLLPIPQGGSAEIRVNVSRVGAFTDSLDITVDGLPWGVTASPLQLGAGSTAGTITLTAPVTVGVPSPDSVRVRGHATTGSNSARIQVTVRGPAGTRDLSFGHNGEATLPAAMYTTDGVAEQADGKLVYTGTSGGGIPVCRLDVDGNPDLSFGSAGGCEILDPSLEGASGQIAVYRGAIYVTGVVLFPGMRSYTPQIARLTEDGEIDATFGDSGTVTVAPGFPNDMFIADDKIVIAGVSTSGNGFLTRMNLDGSPDASFATNVFGSGAWSESVARLTDCRLVVSTGTELYALQDDGAPDLTFGTNGREILPFWTGALASVGNGDFVASGVGMGVTRFSPQGAIDATYDPLPTAMSGFSDLKLEPDGTMVLSGSVQFTPGDDFGSVGVARRNPIGSADPAFGPNGTSSSNFGIGGAGVEILGDGRYMLFGSRELEAGFLIRVWN